jgi:hypothetical protein
VVNLSFHGRLLPLMQRVSGWQAISVTRGEFSRVALHKFTTRISPTFCRLGD